MKNLLYLPVVLILLLASCNNTKTQDDTNQIKVQQVEQASNYTYVMYGENEWLAIPKTDIEVGQSYYVVNGKMMENFTSKDLDKTFEKITFAEALSTEPVEEKNVEATEEDSHEGHDHMHADKKKTTKKIEVTEVLQANQYTYVKGLVDNTEEWLAIPKKDIKTGTTYYYLDGMVMENFESKDLNRTFEEVIFTQGLSETKEAVALSGHGKPQVKIADSIAVEQVEGALTLKELFENKDAYNGKTVTVHGKLVKVNNEIMNKNWVHLQDGSGEYDLTITTLESLNEGDEVTMTGSLILDKDFGYGYYYEVLLEDAKVNE